jgi:hypothetical protein
MSSEALAGLSLRGAQRRGNLGPVPHWIEIAASLRSSQ